MSGALFIANLLGKYYTNQKAGETMGIYLNPGNGRFQQAINSKLYVDKTEILVRIKNTK